MNTVEASILLEEAIDLAAASPDDAIYARLLAFRDGWFRNRRISAPMKSLSRGPAGKVGHSIGTYTLEP